MSLRNKLILLFLGLAVFPLLLLAAFSYWHAQNLLHSTVQAQLQEAASNLSQGLDVRASEIKGALTSVAGTIPSDGDSLYSAGPEGAMVLPGSPLAGAEYLRYRDVSGRVWMLLGNVPEDPVQCRNGVGARVVEFSPDAVGGELRGTLSAGFWTSDLVDFQSGPESRRNYLFDPLTDRVLFSSNCQYMLGRDHPEFLQPLKTAADPEEGSGSFAYSAGGDRRLGAFAGVPLSQWQVISTSTPIPVAASINRMVVAYWIFVLGLGLTTMVAFSMALGKFTKSLQELARAAEEIGTGELDPWLPLPTSGEVGQLTLAFSRMLARIRQMMAKVDQSGRLAVVGQLSAYLAHEIRNPLSSIKLNLQRLQRWTRNGRSPGVLSGTGGDQPERGRTFECIGDWSSGAEFLPPIPPLRL